MPGLPLVIIPHPMAKRRPDEVAAVAAGAVDEVISVWSDDAAKLSERYKARVPEQVPG